VCNDSIVCVLLKLMHMEFNTGTGSEG